MDGPEVRIEVREGEADLSAEALGRAFDLLATLALRREGLRRGRADRAA